MRYVVPILHQFDAAIKHGSCASGSSPAGCQTGSMVYTGCTSGGGATQGCGNGQAPGIASCITGFSPGDYCSIGNGFSGSSHSH